MRERENDWFHWWKICKLVQYSIRRCRCGTIGCVYGTWRSNSWIYIPISAFFWQFYFFFSIFSGWDFEHFFLWVEWRKLSESKEEWLVSWRKSKKKRKFLSDKCGWLVWRRKEVDKSLWAKRIDWVQFAMNWRMNVSKLKQVLKQEPLSRAIKSHFYSKINKILFLY